MAFREERFEAKEYDTSRVNEVEKNKYGLAMDHIVRWKDQVDENGRLVTDQDGVVKIQSNSRIVKWSDGTFMLQVGRHFFKMDVNPTTKADQKYVYAQQKVRAEGDKSGESGSLYLRSHGRVKSVVRFAPTKRLAERLKLKEKMREGRRKTPKVKKIHRTNDADLERETKIRAFELDEKRKVALRESAKSQRRRSVLPMRNMHHEDEDEEELADDAFDAGHTEALSVNDLKSKYSGKRQRDGEEEGDFSYDEDDDDYEKRVYADGDDQRLLVAKQSSPQPSTSESQAPTVEENAGTFNVDVEDDDEVVTQKPAKRSRRAIVDDDDDSD